MQICKENLPFAQLRILWLNRFFDFDDHLRTTPDLLAIGQGSPRFNILLVLNPAAFTRTSLNQHGVALVSQGFHTSWNQANAVLVILNLCWDADDHTVPRKACLRSQSALG